VWKTFINDSVKDLQNIAQEKHIKLSSEIPDAISAIVSIDKVHMIEVISNLITNAINYTNPDGKITVTVEETPEAVITHIQDTGIGIPEQAIPHLFSKFFRVSEALRAESKGTGLGLYLAKANVEMHRGKIWVESKVNEGSTFSFSLPKKK
jgi:signal transduction histidine kinase